MILDADNLALTLPCDECGAERGEPCPPWCTAHAEAHGDGGCDCAAGPETLSPPPAGPLRADCPECGSPAGVPCPTPLRGSHLARVLTSSKGLTRVPTRVHD